MTYEQIEKNIPIPQPKSIWYTVLDRMEIGDSALFPPSRYISVRNNLRYYKPKTFCFRCVASGDYRCWRIT